MASDISSSRFLLITLLLAVGVLGYYYFDASAVANGLYNDAERLRLALANANKTIADLRREREDCQAQTKAIEEDRNKVKADVEAKDKVINEKQAAEKKATDEAAQLKKDKEAIDAKLKAAEVDLTKQKNDCDDRVKKAEQECLAKPPAAGSAAQVAQPATS